MSQPFSKKTSTRHPLSTPTTERLSECLADIIRMEVSADSILSRTSCRAEISQSRSCLRYTQIDTCSGGSLSDFRPLGTTESVSGRGGNVCDTLRHTPTQNTQSVDITATPESATNAVDIDKLPSMILPQEIKGLTELGLRWTSGSIMMIKTPNNFDSMDHVIPSEPLGSVLTVRTNNSYNSSVHHGWTFPGGTSSPPSPVSGGTTESVLGDSEVKVDAADDIFTTISRGFCEDLRMNYPHKEFMEKRVREILTEPQATVGDLIQLECFKSTRVSHNHPITRQPLHIKWGLNLNARKALQAYHHRDFATLNTFIQQQSETENSFPMVLVGWLPCPISMEPILQHFQSTENVSQTWSARTDSVVPTENVSQSGDLADRHLLRSARTDSVVPTETKKQTQPSDVRSDNVNSRFHPFSPNISAVGLFPLKWMMGPTPTSPPTLKPFVIPTINSFNHHHVKKPTPTLTTSTTDSTHAFALIDGLHNVVNGKKIITREDGSGCLRDTRAPFHIQL